MTGPVERDLPDDDPLQRQPDITLARLLIEVYALISAVNVETGEEIPTDQIYQDDLEKAIESLTLVKAYYGK